RGGWRDTVVGHEHRHFALRAERSVREPLDVDAKAHRIFPTTYAQRAGRAKRVVAVAARGAHVEVAGDVLAVRGHFAAKCFVHRAVHLTLATLQPGNWH